MSNYEKLVRKKENHIKSLYMSCLLCEKNKRKMNLLLNHSMNFADRELPDLTREFKNPLLSNNHLNYMWKKVWEIQSLLLDVNKDFKKYITYYEEKNKFIKNKLIAAENYYKVEFAKTIFDGREKGFIEKLVYSVDSTPLKNENDLNNRLTQLSVLFPDIILNGQRITKDVELLLKKHEELRWAQTKKIFFKKVTSSIFKKLVSNGLNSVIGSGNYFTKILIKDNTTDGFNKLIKADDISYFSIGYKNLSLLLLLLLALRRWISEKFKNKTDDTIEKENLLGYLESTKNEEKNKITEINQKILDELIRKVKGLNNDFINLKELRAVLYNTEKITHKIDINNKYLEENNVFIQLFDEKLIISRKGIISKLSDKVNKVDIFKEKLRFFWKKIIEYSKGDLSKAYYCIFSNAFLFIASVEIDRIINYLNIREDYLHGISFILASFTVSLGYSFIKKNNIIEKLTNLIFYKNARELKEKWKEESYEYYLFNKQNLNNKKSLFIVFKNLVNYLISICRENIENYGGRFLR